MVRDFPNIKMCWLALKPAVVLMFPPGVFRGNSLGLPSVALIVVARLWLLISLRLVAAAGRRRQVSRLLGNI